MQKNWYVIQVYSGFEKKVVQAILEQAEKTGLSDRFEQLLVPSQETIEIRRGKKCIKDHTYFPGYILAKMQLDDEVWHLVRNIPKVSSFLGSKSKPTPISETEVSRILQKAEEDGKVLQHIVEYEVGGQVKVLDGPFTGFSGIIEELDEEKERMKVLVGIFGRPTPVDLEFTQVEKI
jgi:transcriptional antiterminator NusG